MNLLKQIHRIEQLDQLIRMKATGKPSQLAKRMNISRRTLYNIIYFIKSQGVKIYYCPERQSFCYEEEVYFYFGFSIEKPKLKRLNGGIQNIFNSAEFLHYQSLNLHYNHFLDMGNF